MLSATRSRKWYEAPARPAAAARRSHSAARSHGQAPRAEAGADPRQVHARRGRHAPRRYARVRC